MTDARRLISLVLIMVLIALMATGVSIFILYRTALDEEKDRLTEIVQSQARLIEAVAEYDSIHSADYPGGSIEGTLSQIRNAHAQYEGFGDTGEFTLAKLERDMIVFLLRHRHYDLETPKPVPLDSELAEPMRRALMGLSGTVIGYDYRGEQVLAAYEPVAGLNMGIVAKIDIKEIRAPFVKAGMISMLSALVLILFGVLLFRRISDTILKNTRESERKYRLLADNTLDVIWVMGFDLIFTYVNPAIETIFGFTPEEWIGTSLDNHCSEEQFLMMTNIIKEELENIEKHTSVVFETVLFHKDGHDVPVEIHGAFLFDEDGKLAAIQGTTRDITERKNAERLHGDMETELRQAQKMEAVGRLAGGIAHDFNNMLGVILGYSDLAMKRIEPDSPIFPYLQEIQTASKRSSDLTRQLLAFSRKEIIQPKVINLNEMIRGQLKMLEKLIGEDIDIDFIAKEDLWNVEIDPVQIDQILANLGANARDAIGGVGSVIIETDNVILDESYSSAHLDIVPGEYVMVSFSDTGQGMDTATLENIFEPFFTTKGRGEGTGLGLATIFGIVKQNNGTIHVYSESNHGTTFKIYLPRCAAEIDDEREIESIESLRGTETVLIVEDEPQVLTLAESILNQLGYTVFAVKNPTEAISFVETYEGGIDLLLTDVVMPGMNGRELKQRFDESKPNIKTLYMSGYTENVIAQRGVLEEGIDFIRKPFSAESLSRKVREVLDS